MKTAAKKANTIKIDDHWKRVKAYLPTILLIIGTALSGYATVVQFTLSPKSADERSRLQRSQLVVDIAEGQRDQWQIALNQELARDKRNNAVLSVAALEYIRAAARWRAYLKMRVSEERSSSRFPSLDTCPDV